MFRAKYLYCKNEKLSLMQSLNYFQHQSCDSFSENYNFKLNTCCINFYSEGQSQVDVYVSGK